MNARCESLPEKKRAAIPALLFARNRYHSLKGSWHFRRDAVPPYITLYVGRAARERALAALQERMAQQKKAGPTAQNQSDPLEEVITIQRTDDSRIAQQKPSTSWSQD